MCLAQTEPIAPNNNISLSDRVSELGENVSKRFIPTPSDKEIASDTLVVLKRLTESLR